MIHFNRTALSLFLVIIMIFQFVPANAEPAAYTVNIEFDIIRILTKQSLVLYIDGKKTKTMEPGAKDLKLTLAPGNHTFKFSTEKDSDISDKITLNIRGDGKYRFTISYTGLSVVAIHRLIEGNKPASSQSTSQKSSKAFPIEALDAYNFFFFFSTSETGHKYRYTEKYYFDLLNNVLVRTWEKRSGNKNTSGYDVYALVTKNGKVYAYDSDGEKSLCFEILDKDKLREKANMKKSMDGVFWDIRQYSIYSGELIAKMASWDIKTQPPKNMPSDFYAEYPNPEAIAAFIK